MLQYKGLGSRRRGTDVATWRPALVVRLLRKPMVFWPTMALLAAGSLLPIIGAQRSANDARQRWGETAQVWVVSQAVERGDTLSGVTEMRNIPASMLPADALSQLEPDAVAATSMFVGEVLVTPRVVSNQSVLAPGTVAVGVPRSHLVPAVLPGSQVVLVLTLDPFGAGDQTLVRGQVANADESVVMVAIATDELGPVMAALAQGTVGLAVTND